MKFNKININNKGRSVMGVLSGIFIFVIILILLLTVWMKRSAEQSQVPLAPGALTETKELSSDLLPAKNPGQHTNVRGQFRQNRESPRNIPRTQTLPSDEVEVIFEKPLNDVILVQ